jgi:hypothetical protein
MYKLFIIIYTSPLIFARSIYLLSPVVEGFWDLSAERTLNDRHYTKITDRPMITKTIVSENVSDPDCYSPCLALVYLKLEGIEFWLGEPCMIEI